MVATSEKEKTIDLAENLSVLAQALVVSGDTGVLLYEENENFYGVCNGQLYDFEIKAIKESLLKTGSLSVDEILPLVVAVDVKPSNNTAFPQVLQMQCILGDMSEFSYGVCYSNKFDNHSNPVILAKYCGEGARGVGLNPKWEKVFSEIGNALQRRVLSGGTIRPRGKYRVGESV